MIRTKRFRHTALATTLATLSWTFALAPMAVSAAQVQSLSAVVSASGSVRVTWDRPSDATSDGDYSYTVYYRAGSSGGFSTVTTGAGVEETVLTELTGGQSYEVRVTATPTRGVSVGREGCSIDTPLATTCPDTVLVVTAVSVTAATAPAAPTISSVTPANGQITVAFSPGASNGATVTLFTATCGSLSNTGTESPIVVTGLTNGIATTCTVVTGSNVGDSPVSAASVSATPSTTPDQMAAPTVSARSGSAVVTWTLVTATGGSGVSDIAIDDGGSAVTGYEISITNASTNAEVTTASAGADAATATVTGLTNGTAYKARVRAANANGSGSYSDYSSSFTPVSDDLTPPTVTVGRTGSGTLRAGGTASVTFTLSESSTDFVVGDVTVSGGSLSDFAGSGTAYTATFTLSASGTGSATVSVAAGSFTDDAGNSNTASNTLSIAYDTDAPTVTVGRTGSGTLGVGGTASVTFTLSESSTDFLVGDVTVSGGSLSSFTGSGTSYSATFTLSETGTGTASVSVDAAKFSDAAGNTNTSSNTLFISYETVAPTISVDRSGSGSLKAGETDSISFTLSESSTNFVVGDVTVSGGSLSSFTGSGTSYSATFAPTASSSGTASISVGASAFTDAAGNGNEASNSVSIAFDTSAPTVTVGRTGSGTLGVGGTASVTFTLSESSTDFVVGDVTVSGGSLSDFAGSGTDYTATFTLSASGTGSASVSVAGGAFTDAAGNGNSASTALSISYDTVAPTITVGRSGSGTVYAGQTITVTFTLSESTTGFAVGDVTVSDGTLSGFSGSGTSYSATYTPPGATTDSVTISVDAAKFADAAGNDNTASNTLTIPVDTNSSPPTTTAPAPAPTTTTTTTVPPVPTTGPTTTVPPLVVPPRLGTEVKGLPPVPAGVAEKTAVAVRNGTLTVLIDPPNLPRNRAISKYVISLRPTGGGRPITRTVQVGAGGKVLMPRFTGLNGGYRVSISAVNRRGVAVGSWQTPRIAVRR